MFFKNKIQDLTDQKVKFSKTEVKNLETEFEDYINNTIEKIESLSSGKIICTEIKLVLGFTPALIKKIKNYSEYKKHDEAFAINIGSKTTIWATQKIGFIYAISTLLMLAESGELCKGFIYDYPIDDIRGFRVFLPARHEFEAFRKMVDKLAYYRYNALMIEIGGAMEYKRHPEINETWLKICEDITEYSGKGNEIQLSKQYPKNCFHCDNAGGSFLLQSEVRELVNYCRTRGLDVIPECPTLCHCDYLVTAHPEIAERDVNIYPDKYPDHYCPNHPDTYKLVFDILEEVIEVFNPKSINIGHDEAYSVSVCPKCRKTPAPKIYADDVWKIRNFLAERNVHVYMAGEKLLNAYHFNGVAIGGAGRKSNLIPALYPCRDLLPKDITLLHWYYMFNQDYEKVYYERDLDVVYANLNALRVANWNKRRNNGIHGGFVSNWGSLDEEYLQRNLQYFSLVNTAYAFWCDDFEVLGKDKLYEVTAKELYRLKCATIKNPIKITHTTSHNIPYKCFYDGVFITDDYILGNYEITYRDGTISYLPVKYGTHITTDSFENYTKSNAFAEVTYSTLPKKAGNRFVYECVYENPNPEKFVSSIKYVPYKDKEDIDVDMLTVDFCTNYSKISSIGNRNDIDSDSGLLIYE